MNMVLHPEEVAAFDRGGPEAVAMLRAASLSLGGGDSLWLAQLVGGGRRDKLDAPLQKSEWAYACIHAIATNLSTLPIVVARGPKKKPDVVTAGPVFELFESPCNGMPSEDWAYRVAMWLLLRGDSFAAPFRDGKPMTTKGVPDQLIPVASSAVDAREERAENGVKKLRSWCITSASVEYPADIMPQVLYPHPNSEWRGLSPMDVAFAAADAAYQASIFNSEFLKNSGFLGGVITSDMHLGADKLAGLERQVQDKTAGPKKAGKILVLPKGQSFTPNPVTHRDAQFLEGMRWSREAVCAVFGVPLSVIGGQAVNYATKLSDDKCFWERGVLPVARRIANYYNAWLRRMGSQEWIYFDASEVAVLQEDLSTALDKAKKLAELGYTSDEINERLRLRMPTDKAWRKHAWTQGAPTTYASLAPSDAKPVAAETGAELAAVAGPVQDTAMNGAQIASLAQIVKDVAAGDMPAEAASAMITAAFPTIDPAKVSSMVGAAAKLAEKPKATEPAPAPPVPPPQGEAPTDAPRSAPAVHVRQSRQERRAESARFDRGVVRPAERKLVRVGVSFFRKCKQDALRVFDSRAFTPGDVELILRLKREWDTRIKEMFAAPLEGVAKIAAKETLKAMGASFDLDFNDPRWLSTARDRLAKLTGVNETTIERVRSTLVQGLAEGASTAELRTSLAEVFDGNAQRALLVARTEVGTVASSARDEAYGEAGIERLEWLSANDDVVRESHAKADGEIVDRGQAFSNGLRYPHDPAAEADEICNCRCDHAPVL